MGRYGKYKSRPEIEERPWQIHPIWRGIGCIMIILIPVMAYAGAYMLVEENAKSGWIPESFWAPSLMNPVTIPTTSITIPHLFGTLTLTVLLALVGYGVMMVFYALVYSALGPPRLGPLDAPPERPRMKKKYKTRR